MLLYMSAKLRSRCNEMITIICNRNRILHIKDCDTESQKELYTTIRQGLYNVLACNDKDLAAIKWSLSIAMPRSPQIKLSHNPLMFLACTRTAQEKKATPPWVRLSIKALHRLPWLPLTVDGRKSPSRHVRRSAASYRITWQIMWSIKAESIQVKIDTVTNYRGFNQHMQLK